MDFDPFSVSVFQGPTFVIIIMIDSSENTFVKVAFELRVCMFLKSAGMDRVSWRIVLIDSIISILGKLLARLLE